MAKRSCCQAVIEVIPLVAGGAASGADRAAVCFHTVTCESCRADLVAAVALASRIRDAVTALPDSAPGGWGDFCRSLPETARGGRDAIKATDLARRLLPLFVAAGAPRSVCALTDWALSLSR